MVILDQFKRGDSFVFYANITSGDGSPLVGQSENLKSQIRTNADVLVCDLTITETVTDGQYLFTSPDTSTWPIGNLLLDIQINNDGLITSSETIAIPVVKDVTRP